MIEYKTVTNEISILCEARPYDNKVPIAYTVYDYFPNGLGMTWVVSYFNSLGYAIKDVKERKFTKRNGDKDLIQYIVCDVCFHDAEPLVMFKLKYGDEAWEVYRDIEIAFSDKLIGMVDISTFDML